MKAKTYSTAEVAAVCEVDKSTLLRWLYLGKLREPGREMVGHVEARIWTAADLERARAFKEQRYRKRP